MKLVVLICTVFLLYSCSSNINVVGKYTSKSNPDFFQFNADSTFYYKYNAFHVSEFSSGRWSKPKRQKVVLNSSIQSRDIHLKIKEEFDTNNSSPIIKFKFDKGLDLKNYKCVIFINDTLYTFKQPDLIFSSGLSLKEFEKEVNVADLFFRYTRCDSLLSLRVNSLIQSIKLKIIKFENNSDRVIRRPLQTEKYVSLVANLHTTLRVSVSFNDSLFNYNVFSNEIIKIRREGIFLFNENTNRWWYIPKLQDSQR